MANQGQHFVAVIGGAVSGSVCTEILADKGIKVAVIEQNSRPYGKIEDGLPRWHVEQRKQEYARIDARMKKPGVYFVPNTKIGRDVDFNDLCAKWGFSAVILANGAWRDRDLGVPGADDYVEKGLYYQNPFIYWYNHKNEKTYDGPKLVAPDETVVVGGGLASIDVVKVLQLENYERALSARGFKVDMHELEKRGVPAVCKDLGVDPKDLGVKGCLLIYRRRVQDMPLQQPPDNATAGQIAKTEQVRQKVLRLAQDKFLFRVQDCTLTQGILVENGRMVGLKVVRTKVEGRKADPIPGTEQDLRAPLVISSIGSVPEKIPGVMMKGEYYTFADENTLPRYTGCDDHVFGVGNVVTGQGNIRVSLVHSQKVTNELIARYILGDGDLSAVYAAREARAGAEAGAVEIKVNALPALSAGQTTALEQRITAQQRKVGYTADYDSWIAKVTPPDLE
jgi:ferredoxin/flavodoxin---NADP+ reductase